jgi:hypothetical protein
MLRKFLCAAVVCLLAVGFALADDIKGKVKSVDPDKGTITVTVDDKDQTLPVSKDVKLSLGKKVKELKDVQVGKDVVLTTSKQDDKDVVTEIKKK